MRTDTENIRFLKYKSNDGIMQVEKKITELEMAQERGNIEKFINKDRY